MKKRFKCPVRFPGAFMRRKYILLIAVVFLISSTACSGQKEKTESGAERDGAIRKEAAVTDQGEHIEMDKKTGSSQIPEELAQIPKDYFTSAGDQGTLERLTYKTYESMSYQNKEKQLNKTAYVYLPYGYSENRKYNVFYLMHGGWSDETTYLGTPESPNVLVNVIDHAIQDGKMEPVIVVCPTYNNENPDDSADYSLALQLTDNYHNELVNDLIPAVEGTYSTYAGFSSQIEAMLHAQDGIFIAADNEQEGNLAYRVQEGNAHDGNAAMQYIYNGLIWIWK